MSSQVDGLLSDCARQVRSQQPDRWLATLFAPARAREALFALYAFDHEIGKVRHVVSQPMAGLIRLQWWRDALAAIVADRPPAHPVAEALQTMLRGAPACRPHLDAAIDAREHELEDPPPADLRALERQLEGSSGAITQAALVILGVGDAAALEVGRKLGLAVGLADLLRSLEADLRHQRLLLPTAELARHGVGPEATAEALAPVIATIAGRGLERLRAARAERQAVPATALAALLPGTLAGVDLQHLQRTGSTAGLRPRALAPLRLLWCYARGRF